MIYDFSVDHDQYSSVINLHPQPLQEPDEYPVAQP